MQIKIAALFVFETETLKGYDPQIFMFQYNWQELYYLFPQLDSEAKKNPI